MIATGVQRLADVAVEPTHWMIEGLKIRFAQSEPRESKAILLSPWPESVFAYEPVWGRLAQTTQLVAVDLPGFGRSDHRDSLMTPLAMGDFIARLADALNLDRPHIVAPDIGTAASLFAAARHPGRFRSLVVGTGATAVPIQLGDPLREWVFAPDVEPYRQVGGRPIVERALRTIEHDSVSAEARADYLASYEGDRFVESMQYVRSYPQQLELLSEALPTISTPVAIVAGRRDRVVPPVNAEFLHQRLPHSRLRWIDSGHFVWEDAADEYAAFLEEWWAGGFAEMRRDLPRS